MYKLRFPSSHFSPVWIGSATQSGGWEAARSGFDPGVLLISWVNLEN